MKPHETVLSVEDLKAVLNYDPISGVFTWKVSANRRLAEGQVAGYRHPLGYLVVGINRRAYAAHRLAWLHETGSWPCNEIDHKNRIPDDNRIANLREASPTENRRNTKARQNRSGFRGVVEDRPAKTGRRWTAAVGIAGKKVYLGRFDSPEAASEAYQGAARRLFGAFKPELSC